jgi:hypothetical protein
MKSQIKRIMMVVVIFLVGIGIGYMNAPEKIVTETKIVTQVETVEKIKMRTVIKELPSGEKTTTIVYQSDTSENKKVDARTKKVSIKKKLDWSVSVGKLNSKYILSLDRRILGTVSVGYSVVTDRNLKGVQSGMYLRYRF